MDISDKNSISVVIATMNRGDSLIQTIDSILDSDYPNFELIVIDQSTEDTYKKLIEKYSEEPRVIYHHTKTAGMARARNLGVERAGSDIIAITDDDCIVPKNWLLEIQKAFIIHPKVAIIFGNVLPAEHDASSGFIPSYVREATRVFTRVLEKNDIDGLGACIAIRKEIWLKCHGFDNMLGVGGVLHSSSEGDLVLHALYKGYQVCETPDVFTIHYGFRTWAQGSRLIYRYWYGTGAMFGKHLRLYPGSTCTLLLSLAWRWAFGKSRVAASIGPQTQKLYRLKSFVSGFWQGLLLGIDKETGHFKEVTPQPRRRL
jgi:glycosyltransferase involved in cell wall biosynthesis